jgi:hypothetical protein
VDRQERNVDNNKNIVNPIKNPFGMIETVLQGLESMGSGEEPENRKTAITTEVGDQVVDTVLTPDTGKWETGIERHGKWIIVQQYATKAEAEVGHQSWVQAITETPDMPLVDVFLEDLDLDYDYYTE